jgi:hypothetical protein
VSGVLRRAGLWWQRVTIRWRLRHWFNHPQCAMCCGWEAASGWDGPDPTPVAPKKSKPARPARSPGAALEGKESK